MVRYVEPSFTILNESIHEKYGQSAYEKIEQAGRTCYKSEGNITKDSARKFVKMIVGRGHLSVIEHVNVTVKFVCNRGFTHELVRHRPCSYSQESTRYCDYGSGKHGKEITVIDQRATIIKEMLPMFDFEDWGIETIREYLKREVGMTDMRSLPVWKDVDVGHAFKAVGDWITAMEKAERLYMSMREWGAPPQVARGVLPIDVKTEIVMTANLRQWGHVFKMRASPKAHPNMQQLMYPLLERFKQLFPGVYDNLEVF